MGYVFWGVAKEEKVQLGSPSSSKSCEVQVQELSVASVPRRGLCTDEHFSLLGKSCCLAAKIT